MISGVAARWDEAAAHAAASAAAGIWDRRVAALLVWRGGDDGLTEVARACLEAYEVVRAERMSPREAFEHVGDDVTAIDRWSALLVSLIESGSVDAATEGVSLAVGAGTFGPELWALLFTHLMQRERFDEARRVAAVACEQCPTSRELAVVRALWSSR